MTSKRGNGSTLVGALGVPLVLVLGVVGWHLQITDPLDALYRTLQAFVLGDAYRDLSETNRAARPLLEVARWTGAFISFYAVMLLLWSGFSRLRIERAARSRKCHIVVVGDSLFADQLSETAASNDLRREVVQLRVPEQTMVQRARLIRLPFHGFNHNGFDEAGAARASRLVIALNDEAQSIDLALAAKRRYAGLPILTRLNDRSLLRSLHELPGGETLRAFSEPEAAARELMRHHPAFLLAEQRGHGQIHGLLVGDNNWVEALLSEIILSSRSLRLEKPKLTVVVAEPSLFERLLSVRYPELTTEATIGFLPLDLAVNSLTYDAALMQVTAVYVAFDDDTRSLSAALAIRRQSFGWEAFDAPIFVRAIGDRGFERPPAGTALTRAQIVPFGGMAEIVCAAGILSDEMDKAERQWHEAYMRLSPSSSAAVPWGELSEEYRLSNRRAVAHIYAKLFDAGFDLRRWLAVANPWDELPALAPDQSLCRDENELMRLAELEHERWNADRRLLGWRHSSTKDEARKGHPYLVPFADLPPDIQRYDVELIKALDQILPREKDGVRRL